MNIDADLLNKQRDDLLYEIGLIVDESIGSETKSRMDRIFDAMAWMSKKRKDFCNAICESSALSALREHERLGARLALVGAIADLICTCCGKVPVVTVAVLLADEGVNALCCEENTSGEAGSQDEQAE